MGCYKLAANGVLQSIPNPIPECAGKSVQEEIRNAGYSVAVSIADVDEVGGISIYQNEEFDRPKYYVELMGQQHEIASFIADDFPKLLDLLKELQPLINVLGIAQKVAR